MSMHFQNLKTELVQTLWLFKMDPLCDNEFCWNCQEKSENVGHVTNQCPKIQCKKCSEFGHAISKCKINEIETEEKETFKASKNENIESKIILKESTEMPQASAQDLEKIIGKTEPIQLQFNKLVNKIKSHSEILAQFPLSNKNKMRTKSENGKRKKMATLWWSIE